MLSLSALITKSLKNVLNLRFVLWNWMIELFRFMIHHFMHSMFLSFRNIFSPNAVSSGKWLTPNNQTDVKWLNKKYRTIHKYKSSCKYHIDWHTFDIMAAIKNNDEHSGCEINGCYYRLNFHFNFDFSRAIKSWNLFFNQVKFRIAITYTYTGKLFKYIEYSRANWFQSHEIVTITVSWSRHIKFYKSAVCI